MNGNFRLPSEIPLNEWPSPEEFILEAKSLAQDARDRGLALRIMGGMAIFLHSQEIRPLWERLGRLGKKVFTDIDFVAYGKHRIKLLAFFRERGYEVNQRLLYHYGKTRQIYHGPRIPMAEVFYDSLNMNHTVHYKNRLEKDFPTLPPAELLLQKLQMVRMNEKDVKDSIILLRAHELGIDDDNRINGDVLTSVLCGDWGFYHTAAENLKKIAGSLSGYDVLETEDREVVKARAEALLRLLGETPKSGGFRLRAKIGTKVKWYNDVDDWDVIEGADGG